MKTLPLKILAASLLAVSGHVNAYEVWTSRTKVPRSAITSPETSKNLRKLIHGHNTNSSTFRPKDKKNQQGDLPMRASDWKKFFSQTNQKGRRGLVPIPRTHVAHPDLKKTIPSIEKRLRLILEKPNVGQTPAIIMPYDNNKNEKKENGLYIWTDEELKTVRHFLNTFKKGKYRNVKVGNNLRNWSIQGPGIRTKAKAKVIDLIVFEGHPEHFYEDAGKRRTALDFLLRSKEPEIERLQVMFQIPLGPWKTKQDPGADAYQIVRRFVVWIGERYGYEALRGDKIIFQLTTYGTSYKYVPELRNQQTYADTIYGICISLIEQEQLFTGTLKNGDGSVRKPTKEDAYSYQRLQRGKALR